MMEKNKEYKRYAFISYKREDSFIAKMLSLRLACFRLPNDISNEFCNSRRLTPVYRDRENLTSGNFPPELQEALDTSKFLIVICTKNSLKSDYINDEVKHFLTTHDVSSIIPYIPPSKESEGYYYVPALNDAIALKKKENPKYDFLGISQQQEELEFGILHRMFPWIFRYEKSYIRVIARMLELDFHNLWDEHKKFLRRVIRTVMGLFLFFVLLLAYFGVPISAPLHICDVDKNDSLPSARNIVLTIGTAKYPLATLDTTVIIRDIPGKYRFQEIPINIEATYYKPLKQSISLGMGVGNEYILSMKRDSTFAIYYGEVTDMGGNVVSDADVTVGHKRAKTNEHGVFRVVFNVEEQSLTKNLHIEKVGVGSNTNFEESPDSSRFILR